MVNIIFLAMSMKLSILFEVNSEDVREYLCTLMDQEFDTLIEDGSLELVSFWYYELLPKIYNNLL